MYYRTLIKYSLILTFFITVHCSAQTNTKNYVHTKEYLNGKNNPTVPNLSDLELPETAPLQSIVYYDALGREIQSRNLTEDTTQAIIVRRYYDDLGRPYIFSKPKETTNQTALNYEHQNVTDFLNTVSNHAYEQNNYLPDPLSRSLSVMPFGTIWHNSEHSLRYEYFVDPVNKIMGTHSFDEDNQHNEIYKDFFGNKVKTVTRIDYSLTNDHVTTFEYDVQGNLIKTIDPLGNREINRFDTTRYFNQIQLNYDYTNQSITYVRPANANRAIVTLHIGNDFSGIEESAISVKDVENLSEQHSILNVQLTDCEDCGGGGYCQYSYTAQYRIFRNGNWTSWYGFNSLTNLKLETTDTQVELQKLNLWKTGTNCTQRTVYMAIKAEAYTPIGQYSDSKYATIYKYDTMNRLIEKQSSVEGTIRYIYDNKNQLRFVQDANHAVGFLFSGQTCYWTYYKYDEIGRVIETGEFKSNLTQSELLVQISTGTLYGSGSYPTTNQIPVIFNIYDSYTIPSYYGGTYIAETGVGSYPKSQLTITKIYDPNTNSWSEEAYTYDRYGKVTKKSVYIPELVSVKTIYYYWDLSGRLLKQVYQSQNVNEQFVQWFEYDKMGRLDSVFSNKSNNRNASVLEAVYDYDNNSGGKIKRVKIGYQADEVTYSYSIRDWLISINGSKFDQILQYDDAIQNPRYNGSIASMTWQIAQQIESGYDFVYDETNRLTDANFKEKQGAIWNVNNKFSEKNIQYDANGNIKTLSRFTDGLQGVNDYNYNTSIPNCLTSVSGALNILMSYDKNGNMTSDNNIGLIAYDYRNLPVKINLSNGKLNEYAYDSKSQRIKLVSKNGNVIQKNSRIFVRGIDNKIISEYVYASNSWRIDHHNIYGNDLIGKVAYSTSYGVVNLQNQTLNGTIVQSADSFFVKDVSASSGSNLTLQAVNGIRLQPGFSANGATISIQTGVNGNNSGSSLNSWRRLYYISDHLNSVRVILDSLGNLDSWSDYYPFGKEARGSSTSNEPKEQFTGKERDAETGLDYFGARYYNSEIARWLSLDPLKEKHPDWTPYNYVLANPLRLVDPDGRQEEASNNLLPKSVMSQKVDRAVSGMTTALTSSGGHAGYQVSRYYGGFARAMETVSGLGEFAASFFAPAAVALGVADVALNDATGVDIGVEFAAAAIPGKFDDMAVDAYKIAKEGGKHSDLIKNMAGASTESLGNAVESLGKKVTEHLEKIANPDKFIDASKIKGDPSKYKEGLVKKWGKEVKLYNEEKKVLEGMLEERKAQ